MCHCVVNGISPYWCAKFDYGFNKVAHAAAARVLAWLIQHCYSIYPSLPNETATAITFLFADMSFLIAELGNRSSSANSF